MRLPAVGSGNDRRDDPVAAHGVEGRSLPPAPRWTSERSNEPFPATRIPTCSGRLRSASRVWRRSDRERYLDLAVFPEDQPIPEEALRVLWKLDDVDTRDCMTRLVARSLATWADEVRP